ncbi:hypothetical protein T08_15397 [Trichinella sp. T8]|nr:hypothetical protein T08_15397 [Trichinella sp. T8]
MKEDFVISILKTEKLPISLPAISVMTCEKYSSSQSVEHFHYIFIEYFNKLFGYFCKMLDDQIPHTKQSTWCYDLAFSLILEHIFSAFSHWSLNALSKWAFMPYNNNKRYGT